MCVCRYLCVYIYIYIYTNFPCGISLLLFKQSGYFPLAAKEIRPFSLTACREPKPMPPTT